MPISTPKRKSACSWQVPSTFVLGSIPPVPTRPPASTATPRDASCIQLLNHTLRKSRHSRIRCEPRWLKYCRLVSIIQLTPLETILGRGGIGQGNLRSHSSLKPSHRRHQTCRFIFSVPTWRWGSARRSSTRRSPSWQFEPS